MNEENKKELFSIAIYFAELYDVATVIRAIGKSNLGNLDGEIVTNENLHLFRQYRNKVSSSPSALVYDAIKSLTKVAK